MANAANASLTAEVEALRMRESEFEAAQQTAAEEIMSYVESTPILKQAAHAEALEAHPEWQAIVGVGYREDQRRSLIYQHLGKLLTELRRITGGDATKGKQLSDLLFARTHAGEHRRLDGMAKAEAHRHQLHEAITLSLRDFVHAIHEAGGDGRYPDKLRQAQQVVATAVSKAAVLTSVSYKEIGETLGLSARLISQCSERFDLSLIHI